MDRSSSLTLPNKKRRSSRLNATPPPPLRMQPMRSCRRCATEVGNPLGLPLRFHLLHGSELIPYATKQKEEELQAECNAAAAATKAADALLSSPCNGGQVISSVISTSACLDERIESKILSLPKEIMVNILVLLPADVLYDIMRYLCFQWYKIICDPVFIKAHLRRSSAAGLFIQYEKAPYNSFYVDTGMRDCKVMRINFQISCQVWASCDGLVLISDRCDRSILYIANPITKQRVTLPPFKWSRDGYYFTLARARSTGEYKVVGTYKENNGFYCGILNVGKDRTWRTVDTQHISEDMQCIFKYPPQSTGGYVYWAIRMWSNLLTLDVEAEVLLEFPVPKPDMLGWEIWYMAMGNFLGCMFWDFKAVLVGVLDFEVLVLADPKTGEWKNRYKFDLNGKREMISLSLFKEAYPQTRLDLQPVAWVNNGEVLVCTTYDQRCKSYIAHNVETGETYSFDLYKKNNHPFWCPHVSSLASLDLPK